MGFEYQALASGEFRLPDGWKISTIKEVADINALSITKKATPSYINYIDIASVNKGHLLNVQRLSFDKAPSRARRIVRDNDILISTVRPNLEHYLFIKKARPNTIASTGFAVVSAKSVTSRFLYYYLTSKQFTEYLTRIAESHTSAYPAFNPDVIEDANILLPPDKEQRAIAHILGTLDDKIELNRNMNETLEAMAQALFKSWFVDFDPVVVNAIKAGNPIPDKFAKRAAMYGRPAGYPDNALGLPEHILRLFPDRFVDSEPGPIPEGWEVKQLGALLSDLVSGSRPRGGAISEGVPSIGAENILGIGRYDYSKEKFIPESHYQKMIKKGADVRPGDVLLYKDGAKIGRKTYFDCGFPHTRCAVNEHVFILRSQQKTMQRFIYFWLDLPWTTEKIIALNTNSAQPGINKNGVYSLPILFPGDKIMHLFDNSIAPLTNRIFSNSIESRTLADLRDTLLPKLISGELRVRDAEKILEEGYGDKTT